MLSPVPSLRESAISLPSQSRAASSMRWVYASLKERHGLAGTIGREALVMTYNDLFLIVTLGTLIVAPLGLFLKPLSSDQPVVMH